MIELDKDERTDEQIDAARLQGKARDLAVLAVASRDASTSTLIHRQAERLRAAGGLVAFCPLDPLTLRILLPEVRRFPEQNYNAAFLVEDGRWSGDAAVIEWASGVLAATETP